MWTFSDTDFLPHVMAGDPLAGHTPVIVTHNEEAELPHTQMLVNLTDRAPLALDRFERVFEIISTDEADAAAGRRRYASYKQQSYPLEHFVAGKR
jgi:DNA polymerase-3 subunit chi